MKSTKEPREKPCDHGSVGYCDDCVSEAEYLRCELRKLKAKKKVRK